MKAFSISLLVLTVILVPAVHSLAEETTQEHEVKAAFLYNFAKFVEWPESSFNPGDKSFNICVVNREHYMVVENLLYGKRLGELEVVVKSSQSGQRYNHCHIFFVSDSHNKELESIANALKGQGVLIVAESEGAAQRGAMINFYMEDDRVRFEINIDEAARDGLRISSKLLRLGRIVQGQPPREKPR